MSPHSGQARQKILVLCKLYLCLCVCGLCPLGEYVEYKVGPVKNPYVEFPFYVPELGRGQLVVEDYGINLVFSYEVFDFLQLSAPYVCP